MGCHRTTSATASVGQVASLPRTSLVERLESDRGEYQTRQTLLELLANAVDLIDTQGTELDGRGRQSDPSAEVEHIHGMVVVVAYYAADSTQNEVVVVDMRHFDDYQEGIPFASC